MIKFIKYLSLVILFLLPFQTRWIYEPIYVTGFFMEWFSGSIYAIEILIWIVVVLTFFSLILEKNFWTQISQAPSQKEKIMKIIRPTGFLIWLLVYWLLVPLNRDLSQIKIFFLLSGACFALTLLLNKINFKHLLYALWGGGVLQAFIGIVQFIFQRTWGNKWFGWALHQQSDLGAAVIQSGGGERWLRSYGSFGWPNDLGFYLSITFILGIFLWFLIKNKKERVILLSGQLLLTAGIFFSFSRAAVISLFVGLLIMFFQQKKKILQPLFCSIILFVILSIIYLPLLQSRVVANNYLENRSISDRFEQYQEFKNVFYKYPILGVGPGNYVYALFVQNSKINTPWLYQPVHNIYLLFLAEWGMVGGVLVLSLIAWLLKEIWQKNKEILPVWGLLFIAFLFDHYFYTSYSGLVLFMVIISISLLKTKYS